MKGRVLLVEGKKSDEHSLQPALERAGFVLHIANTGKEALDVARRLVPAIIIFDTTVMRSSGARTCRLLRRELPRVPLIHCRADGVDKDASVDAHVYLQRPFTPRKLLNRMRHLLPAEDSEDQIIRCGYITLYTGKRSVDVGDRGEFILTPKTVGLLKAFLTHPNETLSRKQLMKWVWQTDYLGDTRTLDVHIRWLREIVEEDPGKPRHLRTVRGKGYCFHMPAEDGQQISSAEKAPQ